jgi:hypothetical protein
MGQQSKVTVAWLNNLTVCRSFKYDGENRTCVKLYLANLINLISYTNRAAHFISAYGQDLTGPEAAGANHKYHSHRTLPTEMASKLKKKSMKTSMALQMPMYKNF